MTALFESIIFGPIRSRRLGLSLGVNLLPQHAKICSFDCIYCECGSNSERRGREGFANFDEVVEALEQTLTTTTEPLDVITFAGNGEPTLHPQFEQIIERTIDLRDRLMPTAKISVLSNATNLGRESVVRGLRGVDNNILKLDSAIETTAKLIDRPGGEYNTERVIEQMRAFEGECIVQTMFLQGEVNGVKIDNTSEEEVTAWLAAICRISPRQVMIYSIDRETPVKSLKKVDRDQLELIAERVRRAGFECSVA
ncbi:MAG: radical SAM protein [Rikenellaceae bacterium]